MIAEMLKLKTGIDLAARPLQGRRQGDPGRGAGEVQLMFENPSVSLPLVRSGRSGRSRRRATRAARRHRGPTMIEAAFPISSRCRSPALSLRRHSGQIIPKLNAAANDSLKYPEVRGTLTRLAVEPRPGSPADSAAFVGTRDREVARRGAGGEDPDRVIAPCLTPNMTFGIPTLRNDMRCGTHV